jgi:hypothetical protein
VLLSFGFREVEEIINTDNKEVVAQPHAQNTQIGMCEEMKSY